LFKIAKFRRQLRKRPELAASERAPGVIARSRRGRVSGPSQPLTGMRTAGLMRDLR